MLDFEFCNSIFCHIKMNTCKYKSMMWEKYHHFFVSKWNGLLHTEQIYKIETEFIIW